MTDEGSGDGEYDAVTTWLLNLYRRYLGEPDQLRTVYTGFGLFFAGVACAAVGMGIFLWSGSFPPSGDIYWQLREVAISLTMLGLPSFLLGIVVLLPVDRRARYVGILGWLVGLVAVGLFVANYPYNWNVGGSDATATGVSVYAFAVVLSSAAVGAALVSTYISRSAPEPTASDSGSASEAQEVSDEQVRGDIEEAMANSELSWGGVEKDDTKRLKLRIDDEELDRSGFDRVGANESRAAGSDVDNAVTQLGKLRGGNRTQATGEGTDDQTDALRQLRERQAQDVEGDVGPVGRFKGWAASLRKRFSG